MTDERNQIFEDLLKIVFKCDNVGLNKIASILRDARLLYGQEAYFGSLTALSFDWKLQGGPYDPIREVYYALIKNILGDLLDYEGVDDITLNMLDNFKYDDPNWRFSLGDFKSLPAPLEKKEEIIQKLNGFLDFTKH